MSIRRLVSHTIAVLLFSIYLVGCLDTGIKNLGDTATDTYTSISSGVDTFSINLAYRASGSRVVQMQGVQSLASASLTIPCGTSGSNCTCNFYRSTTDTNPAGTSLVGISAGVNTLSCTIAGSADPSTFNYVRLFNSSGTSGTGYINITSNLTITNVIGALDKNQVRGIYSYTCSRTFFEGSGVSGNSISCPASQALGLIYANYSFYLYSSYEASNNQPASITDQKSSGSVFPSLICNAQFTQTACPNSPVLKYGLYGSQNSIFTVGITMTDAPTSTSTASSTNVQMGFAALPDTAGNCPVGMVKIRPYVAQPSSIVAGSLGNSNPPSNFLNNSNSLNDTAVEAVQPSDFYVTRQANATPCTGTSTDTTNPTGNCAGATYGGSSVVEDIAYTPSSPVVCALPASLLTGVIP